MHSLCIPASTTPASTGTKCMLIHSHPAIPAFLCIQTPHNPENYFPKPLPVPVPRPIQYRP